MTRIGWLLGGDGASAARMQLVCVPYLGGGPHAFRGWPEALRGFADVLTVQYPGSGARVAEAPLASIRAIAGGVATAIAADVAGPYVLLGYSMGALVAYETTRLLVENRLRPPASLIVAAHAPPQAAWPHPPASSGSDSEVLAHLRRYEGMPEAVMADAELAAILMPTIRASLRAMETYVAPPTQPFAIPILAICGDADPTVTPTDMDAWREHTSESFRLAVVPGGHFFVHQSPTETVELVRSELQYVATG